MNTDENTDPCSSVVSFCAVYADENPCRVAKDFRRSARRGTENPDASVKSPCPPCLRGETGRLAAPGSLSESQLPDSSGKKFLCCRGAVSKKFVEFRGIRGRSFYNRRINHV